MIIITETYGANGKKVFKLEELETGQSTTWSPPKTMDKSEYKEALLQVAKRWETMVQQKQASYPIAAIPLPDEDVTADTTFGIYAAQVYIPRRVHHIAEKTLDGWKSYLRLRILPAFGHIALGEIRPGRLMDFFAGMEAEGLSYNTIGLYYSFLSGVFRMAHTTGIIPDNPMKNISKPGPRKDQLIEDGVEACTAEEIAQLLQLMEKEPLKWQVIVRLLIETGMRAGECMALKWSNINWKTNAITIRASLGYTVEKGTYLTTPKNRKARTVYVSDDMMYLLLRHSIVNYRDQDSPFVNHQTGSTEPMHPHSPGKYLRKLAAKYGLPHIHPHKLRHSYASIAITNGADVTSVADNLGHSDSSITLRVYSNANENSKRNASNICFNAVRNAVQTSA